MERADAYAKQLADTAARLQEYVDTGQTPEMVLKLVAVMRALDTIVPGVQKLMGRG